jgi:RNA polymerase sigma factor (sigma-70 family)
MAAAKCQTANQSEDVAVCDMIEAREVSEAEVPRLFATTRWNVVKGPVEDGFVLSQHAFEALCGAYWYPVYVHIRRKGHGPDDARDLTQQFFSQLIARRRLRLADWHKGKFRSFLLAALDDFIGRSQRLKRRGPFKFVPLEQTTAAGWSEREPSNNDNPEKQFHKEWALTVLRRAMGALESECIARAMGRFFNEVKTLLSGERGGMTYVEVGNRLDLTEGTVRVTAHRLRQRYFQLLRHEIAQTIGTSENIEEELRELLRVFGK